MGFLVISLWGAICVLFNLSFKPSALCESNQLEMLIHIKKLFLRYLTVHTSFSNKVFTNNNIQYSPKVNINIQKLNFRGTNIKSID